MEDRIRLLSMVDIFAPLSEEEIEHLNGQLPDQRLKRGEIFYGPQDPSEKLFILQKGKVRIFRIAPSGKELTLAVVGAGTVFGEMALTDQQLEGNYAQAMEPSVVSMMSREDLERLILEKPEVGLQLVHLLSERLRLQSDRLEDISLKSVDGRLANIILELVEAEGIRTVEGYRIPTHYTHEELGTMIAANRVAVTRAFKVLQDEGVVELRRRRIHVTDPERLESLAGYGNDQQQSWGQ